MGWRDEMRRKVERQILAWLLGLVTLLGIPRAGSASDDEDEFILRCSPEAIHEIVRRHGLTLIRSHGSQNIHFVRATVAARPEHFLSDLRSDPDVQGIEADTDVMFPRSEEHTSELQSPCNLVCRLLLEKKKKKILNGYAE